MCAAIAILHSARAGSRAGSRGGSVQGKLSYYGSPAQDILPGRGDEGHPPLTHFHIAASRRVASSGEYNLL